MFPVKLAIWAIAAMPMIPFRAKLVSFLFGVSAPLGIFDYGDEPTL